MSSPYFKNALSSTKFETPTVFHCNLAKKYSGNFKGCKSNKIFNASQETTKQVPRPAMGWSPVANKAFSFVNQNFDNRTLTTVELPDLEHHRIYYYVVLEG